MKNNITIIWINEMETKGIVDSKKQYGQFYTTNYNYIFQHMDPTIFMNNHSSNIFVEPFVGKKHLIQYLTSLGGQVKGNYILETYDIDPQNCFASEFQGLKCHPIERDTIMDPPNYKNKIVLTNPPYLAKNKSKDKKYFDKYDQNDLYKCFIETLIQNPPIGGLIIIPLNFWCSITKTDIKLRKRFIEKFETIRVNVFEESVFQDTSYTVCSILFKTINTNESIGRDTRYVQTNARTSIIPFHIYPVQKELLFEFNEKNYWSIGGEIYHLHPNSERKYKIYRLLENGTPNTKILLKALDDDSKNKIRLSISDEPYYGKNTSRTYASIIIEPPISLERQYQLVKEFNEFIESMREKYHSLFLTNYRESKDISRKRISFELVYDVIHYLLLG